MNYLLNCNTSSTTHNLENKSFQYQFQCCSTMLFNGSPLAKWNQDIKHEIYYTVLLHYFDNSGVNLWTVLTGVWRRVDVTFFSVHLQDRPLWDTLAWGGRTTRSFAYIRSVSQLRRGPLWSTIWGQSHGLTSTVHGHGIPPNHSWLLDKTQCLF